MQSRRLVGDVGLIPGSGRHPRGGTGNLLQYSCQKIPMDRGAWQAAVGAGAGGGRGGHKRVEHN